MYKKTKDKVIILGNSMGWYNAPFKDDTFEIWANVSLCMKPEWDETCRVDLLWEIHKIETRNPEHIRIISDRCDAPVMMQHYFLGIPDSVKFPLDEIVEHFGRRYFLCTFAYQIAYAMYLGFKEIHFYGVNMILYDEYIQKWNMEYWLGRAEQAGIKVVIPDDCDLLMSPLIYGYEADNTLGLYMQRYIFNMDRINRINIYSAITKLQDVFENLRTMSAERPKFMKEIFNRHGLKPVVEIDYSKRIRAYTEEMDEPDND